MNREKAIVIAKTLKINISDEVVNDIIQKHDLFIKKLNILKRIDTTGVKEMHRIDETETLFLREDVEGETLPIEVIIDNAPQVQGNFVSIAKVVK